MKRWIVRAGDGPTLEAILKRMNEPNEAIAAGRVFVGRRRASDAGARVAIGDEVRVGAAQVPPGKVSILMQRGGLIACNKPAGVPTVPDHSGGSHSLVAMVARETGCSQHELRVTSRLDREVSGVVVFAVDDDAHRRLIAARAQGKYVRRYVALAEALGSATQSALAEPSAGQWDFPIGRGKDARHRAVGGPESKPATTRWSRAERIGKYVLFGVEPITGRTHQIRVHASHVGMPLLGDRDYGGPTRVSLEGGHSLRLERIALHAAQVLVPDRSGTPVVLSAPVPDDLVELWARLGGSAGAWPWQGPLFLEDAGAGLCDPLAR